MPKKQSAEEFLGIIPQKTAEEFLGIDEKQSAEEFLGLQPTTTEKFLRGAGKALEVTAKILEPLRTPIVGIGGIAAGVKAAISGEGPSRITAEAAKSIQERRGLGRELAAPFVNPGWKQELATLGIEAVTDPLTYIAGNIIPKLGKLVGSKAATAAISRVAAMRPEETVAHFAELARASQGPEPLIKIVEGLTPKQTIFNLLERQARPRLSSEQSILGLKNTQEATRAVANEAINARQAGRPISVKAGQQISEAVAEAVGAGELDVSSAARLLGMEAGTARTQIEMAENILKMKSMQGRSLSQWSRVANEYRQQFAGNKAVQEILKTADVPLTGWERVTEFYRTVDNFRRAAMVSQLATTARNIISQGAMMGIDVIEKAMSGVAGAITGKITPGQATALPLENVISAFRVMTPSGRRNLQTILDKFPVEAARLIRTPIGDVSTDQRLAAILNTFNSLQETYFRRAAADANLRQTAMLAGKSLQQLTAEEIADGVNHALSLTFAKTPKSGPGRAILDLYREIPFLTAVGNPFPRFWVNALEKIYSFSPLPLFRPSTYAAMANKDPRIAFGAINKSAIGAAAVSLGYALDRTGYTGEKWYEIKIGEKRYDARPFAPFTAPLFAGRMLSRVQKEGTDALLKLSKDDWSQALLSMRRTDATGLPLLDAIFARTAEEFKDKTIAIFSGYAGSFVPGLLGRTVQDIMGQVSREERLPRFTRERPLTGQAVANIPFLARTLPVRPSPFRAEPEERQAPLMRQLTGLTYRVKTQAEMEVDRLGIVPRDIYPRTGSPEYDRLIVSKMGPLLEDGLQQLFSSKTYLLMDDKVKREVTKDFIGQYQRAARQIVRGERPDLALEKLEKQSSEFIREAIAAHRSTLTQGLSDEDAEKFGAMAEALRAVGLGRK